MKWNINLQAVSSQSNIEQSPINLGNFASKLQRNLNQQISNILHRNSYGKIDKTNNIRITGLKSPVFIVCSRYILIYPYLLGPPLFLSFSLFFFFFFPTSILSFNIKIQSRKYVLSTCTNAYICNYPESTFFFVHTLLFPFFSLFFSFFLTWILSLNVKYPNIY